MVICSLMFLWAPIKLISICFTLFIVYTVHCVNNWQIKKKLFFLVNPLTLIAALHTERSSNRKQKDTANIWLAYLHVSESTRLTSSKSSSPAETDDAQNKTNKNIFKRPISEIKLEMFLFSHSNDPKIKVDTADFI